MSIPAIDLEPPVDQMDMSSNRAKFQRSIPIQQNRFKSGLVSYLKEATASNVQSGINTEDSQQTFVSSTGDYN
tara:strand:- start:283 stop:501 length:219 start_codon:yes stop_codon:yes gene_type:complete